MSKLIEASELSLCIVLPYILAGTEINRKQMQSLHVVTNVSDNNMEVAYIERK